jgi:hypothetical protein
VGGSYGLRYSVVVAFRVGVICRSCRRRIEIEDEYIRGVRAVEMAEALYKPMGKSFPDLANVAWQRTITCGHPDCRRTHGYTGDDLQLYGG